VWLAADAAVLPAPPRSPPRRPHSLAFFLIIIIAKQGGGRRPHHTHAHPLSFLSNKAKQEGRRPDTYDICIQTGVGVNLSTFHPHIRPSPLYHPPQPSSRPGPLRHAQLLRRYTQPPQQLTQLYRPLYPSAIGTTHTTPLSQKQRHKALTLLWRTREQYTTQVTRLPHRRAC